MSVSEINIEIDGDLEKFIEKLKENKIETEEYPKRYDFIRNSDGELINPKFIEGL